MLITLRLQNIVLFGTKEIDFYKGFTAFTGETGSGKSVFIDVEDKPNHLYVWTYNNESEIISNLASITLSPDAGINDYTLTITDLANCPNDPFSVSASITVNQLDINQVISPPEPYR